MKEKPAITLEDIAGRAGVSTAAVSQALSGKGTLSQATRARILQVVEELSYRPNLTAQNLALRRASRVNARPRTGSKRKPVPPPGVMVFYNISELSEVVQLEIQQMDEEGYEVSQFREVLASWKRPTKQKIYRLYLDVISAPLRPDFAFQEPDSLPEIQKARPAGPRRAALSLTSNGLYERIYGAWLGRVAGCVLGKPLQAGWSKSQVAKYLQMANGAANGGPLDNYVPRVVPPPAGFEFKPEAAGNFLGEINGAPFDDDTDFTLLSLHILEEHGLGFKTADVGTAWLDHIPYFNTHTTDRAIYRNLIWNIHAEDAASYVNPEREFIGARTRADLYGYVAPGMPELAASLAYQDAVLSHTKNGVYSAMFMAAMLAWAHVTNDMQEIVRVGLSEIPAHCRLAEAVQTALDIYAGGRDWELAYEQLILKYGYYSPIHTLNNTLWVVLALLYANGDFDRALGTAVACGMDTGSNAASAGSVMGLLYSSTRIPARWTVPLADTLYTAIAQFSTTRISELAHRTAIIAEKTLSILL